MKARLRDGVSASTWARRSPFNPSTSARTSVPSRTSDLDRLRRSRPGAAGEVLTLELGRGRDAEVQRRPLQHAPLGLDDGEPLAVLREPALPEVPDSLLAGSAGDDDLALGMHELEDPADVPVAVQPVQRQLASAMSSISREGRGPCLRSCETMARRRAALSRAQAFSRSGQAPSYASGKSRIVVLWIG